MIKRIVLIPSILTLTMCANGADLSGPVSGAVFHSGSRSIRPILGVPGSAYLGDSIASGLDAAAVSPNHKLAIAIRNGQGVVFTGLDAASPAEAEVDAIPGADKLFWSSDSTVAGLYSSKSGEVQTWRNGEMRKAESISGNVLALAVDGAGRVYAGVEGDGVYVLIGSAPARLLSRAQRPSAISIAKDDLFFADRSRGEILRIQNYPDATGAVVFASGVADPSGLALSQDESTVLVASAENKTVTAYRLDSGATAFELFLDFEPSGLSRISDSIFRLNEDSAGTPLQILSNTNTPAVYFVPAGTTGN